jgi:hypothetical protein
MCPTNVAIENSGTFSFTMNEKGVASGVLGGSAFTATFAQSGAATATINRANKEVVKVNFQLDIVDGSDRVTGTITDCVNGVARWSADLLGNRNVFNATNKPPVSGLFTLAFLGVTNTTLVPAGNGYATMSVANTGVATISGRLADNLVVTPTATISKDGLLPFYYCAESKEMVIGWLCFKTNEVCLENTNLIPVSGSLTWVKKANYGTYYKAAFSTNIDVVGSTYIAPAKNQAVLMIEVPTMSVTGGNLTSPLLFTPSYNFSTYTYSTNNMSLVITPAKGIFSGSFINAGKTLKINGIVLQKQNVATGFFLGTTQSGPIWLEEQE